LFSAQPIDHAALAPALGAGTIARERPWSLVGAGVGVEMRTSALLFHPSNLPHSDSLGVPTWLQWLVVVLALAIGGWLVLEARADRRARPEPAAPERDDADNPPARDRLVRVTSVARPPTVAPSGATPGLMSPPRLLVLLIGFAAGWAALDRVRAVEALATFIRTGGAAQVARLGFCFAALLWVGAALAPVAPRGAALAFDTAGAIGTFLATASRWERRLEWWGANAVLKEWDRLPVWAVGAFLLALLALAAGRYRRDSGTVHARHSPPPLDPDRLTPG
jgi:hypothetical protein